MYIQPVHESDVVGDFTRKICLKLAVFFTALTGFSSSALAANDANSDEHAMLNASDPVLVFGKFRLLKNGNKTKLSDGFSGNSAWIRLYQADTREELSIKVGEDGEFSRELAPGEYYVMSIAFRHHGQTVEPETNFMFDVSGAHEANYIGTITLEAKFTSGYYGMQGEFERFIISNDCAADCEDRLADLGLQGVSPAMAFPAWQEQVASGR